MTSYAVIPAAGHSRRMGRPKLLLPLGDRTVMARLLAALDVPGIDARVVVVRKSDTELRDEVMRCGATVVSPDVDPPDMRSSVEAALAWIRDAFHPADDDAWLLAPADHPVLDRDMVAGLVATFAALHPRFLVPIFEGQRGHPLIARWDTVQDVFSLPHDVGLNHLLRSHAADVGELPANNAAVLCDLDTPDDYERLLRDFAALTLNFESQP
jgi:molybdenum cofactor cytidylyltransferase